MFKLSHILFSAKRAERHLLEVFAVGFFYASLSLLISLWLLPEYSSLIMVFFTVISCLYLMQGFLIREEKKERNFNDESWLLKQHSRTILSFMSLFFGFLLAYLFWTIVLPDQFVSTVFNIQNNAFESIRAISGNSVAPNAFKIIFFNNLKVLLLSLLLAVFYGAGAIFVLAWNASMMGYVIGVLAKNHLGLVALPYALLKYSLHGIPEMLAYLTASLAGSILFFAIIKGDIREGRAKRIFTDVFIIILISVALLFVSALIESYISAAI